MEPIWREADGLVVNGEGTIHHDAVGALTLIGLCTAAKRLGKHVALVNCSMFELDPFLLDMLRMHVDELVVREPVTLRYLQARQIPARLSADCLFLAGVPSGSSLAGRTWAKGTLPRVIYTPGVLSSTAQIGGQMVANDIRDLGASGREVLYYVVEPEDEPLARVAAAHGARIVPLGAVPWQEVITFLRTAELVVSGRYHINIFSALAGVPFIPMETNTPKMHGLLELIGGAGGIRPRMWDENSAPSALDVSQAVEVNPAALTRCIDLARDSLVGHSESSIAGQN
jgi:polysaccharide pyruvyl transferase WcaK-like protein